MKNVKAFTLVELLVVISIIALLLSILMPALQRAKNSSMAIVCAANVRSLSTAWFMYQGDHNASLVGADPDRCYPYGWIRSPLSPYGLEQHFVSLRTGLLYPYLNTVKVFHCPADTRYKRPPEAPNAIWNVQNPLIGGYNSFKIVNSMNGVWPQVGLKIAKKYTEIKSPSDKLVFVENSDNRAYNHGAWFINTPEERRDTWIDPIALWHFNKGILGFADGHSEIHTWRDKRTMNFKGMWSSEPRQKANPDIAFVINAYLATK